MLEQHMAVRCHIRWCYNNAHVCYNGIIIKCFELKLTSKLIDCRWLEHEHPDRQIFGNVSKPCLCARFCVRLLGIQLAHHQWNRYVKWTNVVAIFLRCAMRRTWNHFQHNLLGVIVSCRMLDLTWVVQCSSSLSSLLLPFFATVSTTSQFTQHEQVVFFYPCAAYALISLATHLIQWYLMSISNTIQAFILPSFWLKCDTCR